MKRYKNLIINKELIAYTEIFKTDYYLYEQNINDYIFNANIAELKDKLKTNRLSHILNYMGLHTFDDKLNYIKKKVNTNNALIGEFDVKSILIYSYIDIHYINIDVVKGLKLRINFVTEECEKEFLNLLESV